MSCGPPRQPCPERRLADTRDGGHHEFVQDEEATRLILETLFDVRAAVFAMHSALLGDEGSDEHEEEEP